ncbi:ABC-2 type transport system permease protein [Crossiella equi]|uniref:ABC-2 type transport system permease protein n=1 Tax=Crossiella equi TaxID=130796 RepID=A0ABS5A5F3_9PSEU|nr:hypothetical protein [Crossiella equi]MBP2471818.1 ABC-2 type transport system permease protein [Crossiella equi]
MTAHTGTARLLRLALRRDRVLLPTWLTAFLLLALTSATATEGLFPTTESLVRGARVLNASPALVAVYGRIHDETSLGAVAMLKAMGTGAVLLAVLMIVLVVRHTRAEEQSGAHELLRCGVVGRQAPLTAALLLCTGTTAVLSALTAVGLALSGLPATGALAFALAWAGIALVFTGIAAVTAQLVPSSRAATGSAVGVLAAAYLLRAVGDTTGPAWLSWLSPVGWSQAVRPFAGDRWWVFLVSLTATALAVALAYRLQARRDDRAGVLAEHAGAVSHRGPTTAAGLAWRLHRGAALAWLVGFAFYGVLVGSVAGSAADLLASPEARAVFTALGGDKAPADTVLTAMFGLLGVLGAAYGVHAVAAVATEETAARADALLSTPTSRLRWAGSHLAVALLGTASLLLTAGLTTGVAHALRTADPAQLTRVLGAAAVHIPAAWVLVGIAALCCGSSPRAVPVAWSCLVGFLLLAELGPLLELDEWVYELSPFAHVPKLPGAEVAATPLLALVAVTALLAGAGLFVLRRRDID